MKIQFYLQSEKSPANIYIRFNDGKKFDIRIKTGLQINPKNWVGDKWKDGRPKTNLRDGFSKKECNIIAKRLKEIDRDLTEKYNVLENRLVIDTGWLNNVLRPGPGPVSDIPTGLVPYFDYYAKVKGNELKKFSHVKLQVVKHMIERMQKNTKSIFQISDIDEAFKNKFVEYSLNEGYAQNTTARNFTFIKTICYHAEFNGIAISPKLKKLNLKKNES